jgi:D-tyrosyl-tRNA(Tyr) deacylase
VRAVVQRVSRACVRVNGKTVGEIGAGLTVLLGVRKGDSEQEVRRLADKCLNLRIFENEEGKFDRSVLDVRGDLLVVSQFTLLGDCRRGRRPDFTDAAPSNEAEALYARFADLLRLSGLKVETGTFGAQMDVEIHNDGPVTLILDSKEGT